MSLPKPRIDYDHFQRQLAQRRRAAALGSEPPPPERSSADAESVDGQERSRSARQGTLSTPYVRRDGRATRSTTVHFPVEVHQQLRVTAAASHRRLSDIVAEAVSEWLHRNAQDAASAGA